MSIAVPSTSLKKKGNTLLSRATADQEKEPQGCEGRAASMRPGGLSPPGDYRGWVAQQARGAGDVPPNSLQSSAVNHHYAYPMPPRLIFAEA